MPVNTTDDRVQRLERLLFDEDPIGLDYEGTNPDEYHPEAVEIAPRMAAVRSYDDTLTLVHRVFIAMFGRDIAGPRRRYQRIAERVWELWRAQ
ncbi:hypothetical protein NQ166_06215 [Microbacterium sp. zg.Y1090]|uniref:hypothetical protein n=1 Tax=Microbacterium TaxID=33882 RepID=UPI00214B2E56|nr:MULTISPECIES: hypothetical protein [unclassified Microbacterium]MCR2812130.1 hypothetical protein [Microbacterium sp. zg.Y1084]MCR2818432.1 hypothetical protein [Microbacterium sp. zg.Y1090]MDL5486245.1 hypothetical protein [Microbacterium sp. zg-Y1211]WIM29443.1 hypothetical protein QNO26_06025 [Microbacterium sp. zg-Y1090]